MSLKNRRPNSSFLAVLAVTAVTSFGTSEFACSNESPTLRELATASREKASRARETTLREILSRQKDDQLKVYLRGSRSMFVNGRSISTGILSTVIRESGLEQATITADPGVHPARVTEVAELIRKQGVKNVDVPTPLTLRELAAATRERVAKNREAKLREILSRQKDDHVKIYLNSRGAYVNGKSISASDLQTIVTESGLKQAIITAEASLARDTVASWEALIRKAGIEELELTEPKRPQGQAKDAKLREVLSRQKGDQLKVYLRNATGVYVNGKSISTSELTKIAASLGLDQAIIIAEPQVSDARVSEISGLIQKSGVKDIQLSSPE